MMKLALTLFSFLKTRRSFPVFNLFDSFRSENRIFLKIRASLFILIFYLTGISAFAQTTGDYQSVASTSWSTLATWQRWSGSAWVTPTGPQGYPGQNAVPAIVTISDNNSVTLDVSPANNIGSLVIAAGSQPSTLTFGGTNTITVNGVITINSGTGNNDNKTIAVAAGTLSAASLTISLTGSNQIINRVTVSTGTLNVTGNITMNDVAARNFVQITSTGFLNIGGAISTANGDLLVALGSTVNYNGAGDQTVRDVTYSNLTISGSGTKTWTLTANRINTGNLLISSGALTTAGNFTLGINGTTNVAGTFNLGGTSAKTFTGDVTLNSGGVWNETGIAAINFGGNVTNNATTFTANTGTHTFTGTTKILSGSTTTSIPSVAITGSYTNSGTLTVNTELSGAGSLSNSGTLNIGGASSITTLANSGTTAISGSGAISTAVANFTNTGTINLNGSGTIAGITNNAAGIVNLSSSGTITSFNNATSTSTLNISTTPTVPTITTLTVTAPGNTVNYNGAGAQTVRTGNYQNLTLSNSGAKTLQVGTTTIGGNLTLIGTATTATVVNLAVTGNLSVGTGTTFTTGANFTLGVTGTTDVTGALTLANTGTKTFTGDVTLNSGGVWNETGIAAINFGGNVTNNATTFTANTGTHTFTGTTKVLSGSTTTSIPSVAITGSYTNSGILTVNTGLSGAGSLSNSGTMNIGGTSSITTLANSGTTAISGSGAISTAVTNFTNTGTINLNGSGTITGITNNAAGIVNLNSSGTIASFNNATSTSTLNISTTPTVPTFTALTVTVPGNTVNYNGAGAQTVRTGNYQNLSLSGSGVKTLLAGTTSIGGNLDIGGTASTTAVVALTISGNVTLGLGATFSGSTFTHNVAGNWVNNGNLTTFDANTSTINFNGTAQSIGGSSATTFNNLILANSGDKTISIGETINGDLSITGTAVALLADGTTSTANTLTLGGSGTPNGSWGGSASAATNINTDYFGTTTSGICNVTISTCTAPNVSDFSAPSASVVCTGNGSVVTINSTSMVTGNYTVTYNVSGTNTVSSTTATMSFTSGAPGTGTFTTSALGTAGASNVVNITAIAFTSTPNCKSTVTASTPAFTTNARPTVTFTAQPGASACMGVDVTYTTQTGGGITNYVWGYSGAILNTDYSITSGGTSGDNTVTLKWLTTGSKTVTINYTNIGLCTAASATSSTATTVATLPTITLAAPGTVVCVNAGVQLPTLTYSATTGSPTSYSIDFNPAANTAGFADVAPTALAVAPGSIPITVPAGMVAGTYFANLTVSNAACASALYPLTISVISGSPNISGLSATAQNTCPTNSVPVTLYSSTLATGTYNVTYNLTSSGNNRTGQVVSMNFTQGSPGSGTFTVPPPFGGSASVSITRISVSGSCFSDVNPVVNTLVVSNDVPDANGLKVIPSSSDVGNTNGTTVTMQSAKLLPGTYRVTFTINTSPGGVFVKSGTADFNIATSRRKTVVGTFTTGSILPDINGLNTAGTYTITVNTLSYLPNSTCITSSINVSAPFTIINALVTKATGSWNDGLTVWGATGNGPDFNNGLIVIRAEDVVTLDGTLTDTLKLDQFIIRGKLIIANDQVLRIMNSNLGDGIDLKIEGAGILQIGTDPAPAPGSPPVVNGTLIFSQGVTHTGTSSNSVLFVENSYYKHFATTSEGSPPLATWRSTATFQVAGYTTANGNFTSPNWSQNFGNVSWNCLSQTGDISLNGLLGAGSIQGNVSIDTTGTVNPGIVRLADANAAYSLNIAKDLKIGGTSRFSVGPTSGNGPDYTLQVQNIIYNSTAPTGSWLCDKGQTFLTVRGNVNVNNGTLFMSSGGGTDRSGTTMNLTGNLTVASGATLDASDTNNDREGKIIFTNSVATHLYTINGTIQGRMLYVIDPNQIVRAVGESAFISKATGTSLTGGDQFGFRLLTDARLIVESTDPLGAIQLVPTLPTAVTGNLRVLSTSRYFASGSTIEYGRTAAAAQFISGTGHPSTAGVNGIINNTSGVTVTAAGTVTIGGNLTIATGNLTVAQSNVIVLQNTNTTAGNIVVNHRPAGGATTFRFTGALTMTGGNVQCNSSTTDNGDNTELEINGDLAGFASTFFSFSGNNCQVTVGGTAPTTFSRDFPISGATTLEQLRINRVGATLVVSQPLIVGNKTGSTYSGGVFLSQGNLRMNSSLTVTTEVNLGNTSTTATDCLGSGILYFEGQTVELQRNIVTCYPNGVFSANSSSILNITSAFEGMNNIIAFTPSTLGTLILNRSANITVVGGLPVTPHVTLNSPLTISGTLFLTDGEFFNQSGLAMASGAKITRTGQSAFASGSVVPTGLPYDVVYNDYTISPPAFINPTIIDIPSGIEIQGTQLRNVTGNLTGKATLTTAMTGSGTLTIIKGTFDGVTFPVDMNSVSILAPATLKAPSSTLTLTGTGSFTDNGTFSHNDGTVNFNGITSIFGTPVGPVAGATSFYDLTVGNTLTSAAGTINVANTFTNNGTFNHNSGTVNFNGTNQSITGSAMTNFNHVTISNTSGIVTLNANANLFGNLLLPLSTSSFDADGSGTSVLTVVSSSESQSGSIGQINEDANFEGNVTIQRFEAGLINKNRYIAIPMPNISLRPDLYELGLSYGGWVYQESVPGNLNNGYVQKDKFYSFEKGRGFLAYMYSNANIIWDVTGPLTPLYNRGNVDLPVSFTNTGSGLANDGWNLVGNPFPAPINWDNTAGWTDSNIDPVVYVPDMKAGVFRTYSRVTHSGDFPLPNGNIALGQAFWVHANASGAALQVKESAKSNLPATFFRTSQRDVPTLTISLSNGEETDNSFLFLRPKTSHKYDQGIDALKLEGTLMGISLWSEDNMKLVHYSTNELPDTDIPMNVFASEEGDYSINFNATNDVSQLAGLFLKDVYTGTAHPISSGAYEFTVTQNVATKEGRFFLSKRASLEVANESKVSIFPNPITERLNIEINTKASVPVSIYQMSGSSVLETTLESRLGIARGSINVKELPSGLYFIKTVVDGQVRVDKVIKR